MAKEKQKRLFIILSLLVFSLAVTVADGVVHPPYFAKVGVKILFFLGLPGAFWLLFPEERPAARELFRMSPRGFGLSFFLGAALFGLIFGGYFLTRPVIDYSTVTGSLTAGMGISRNNFLWVALYMSFANSFLEELFFRGFGFMALQRFVSRPVAYGISSVLFAVYHVGMTAVSFHPAVVLLMMAGLTAGGVIFCGLNQRFGCLYPSWLVHIGADLGINAVGLVLFAAA